jgi:hypothetical protein
MTGADGRAPVSGGNPRILDDDKAQRRPSSGFIFSPGQPVMAQHQDISAGPAAIAATGVSVTAWPGTPVTVTVTPRPLAHAISQGQPIARATVTVGSQVSKITLDASQAAPAPSVRWRLTRL